MRRAACDDFTCRFAMGPKAARARGRGRADGGRGRGVGGDGIESRKRPAGANAGEISEPEVSEPSSYETDDDEMEEEDLRVKRGSRSALLKLSRRITEAQWTKNRRNPRKRKKSCRR